MKEIGLKAYSFSVSWSRIFPNGGGTPNTKGIAYYKHLVEELVKNNITPIVTINHWDIPQALQNIGGWANREMCNYYVQYAEYLFGELGDIVPIWLTHTEPQVIAFAGYFQVNHAPGYKDFSQALLVAHHLLLAHGMAVRSYRQAGYAGKISIKFNLTDCRPASRKEEDNLAARRNHGYWNQWFTDPIFHGRYPEYMVEWYSDHNIVLPTIEKSDMGIISTPVDFVGINNYFAQSVSKDVLNWPLEIHEEFIGEERTANNWSINPDALYNMIKWICEAYNIPIMVTENGASFKEEVGPKGIVEDYYRIDFIRRHLRVVHQAIGEGIPVLGYSVWSLLDNFEWQDGFTTPFGLVHVDRKTLKRTLKLSGKWYGEVIQDNGFSPD